MCIYVYKHIYVIIYVCACACVEVLESLDRVNFHVAFSKVFSVGYSFPYSPLYIASHSSVYVTLPVPLLPFPLHITCILPLFSGNCPMVPITLASIGSPVQAQLLKDSNLTSTL